MHWGFCFLSNGIALAFQGCIRIKLILGKCPSIELLFPKCQALALAIIKKYQLLSHRPLIPTDKGKAETEKLKKGEDYIWKLCLEFSKLTEQ